MDIETNGSIVGVNPGDSKFLGSQARFVTRGESSEVRARRVRSDSCEIQTLNGNVLIGSYIESRTLSIKTEKGNI